LPRSVSVHCAHILSKPRPVTEGGRSPTGVTGRGFNCFRLHKRLGSAATNTPDCVTFSNDLKEMTKQTWREPILRYNICAFQKNITHTPVAQLDSATAVKYRFIVSNPLKQIKQLEVPILFAHHTTMSIYIYLKSSDYTKTKISTLSNSYHYSYTLFPWGTSVIMSLPILFPVFTRCAIEDFFEHGVESA